MNTVLYRDIFGCTATLAPVPDGLSLIVLNPYGQQVWGRVYNSRRLAELDMNSRLPGLWYVVSE